MDHYLQIRLLHRDGLSIRQIARRLGHSRDTVNKALVQPTPLPYTRTGPASCPKLGAFIGPIDQILAEDLSAPRKQRHTAARIFQRLRDERGYLGGYDQVRRYVSARRKKERETHLLLDHPPGGRVECDFGHIHVDFPEGRRLVPVLLAVWSYSHYAFAIALPDETTGSILHGMVVALEFFGCAPAELWWDNPKTVATSILRGRDRQLNVHYASLASHYRFAPMFCMPARGQEKGDVERTVFALERRYATPVPSVPDVDALNRHLLSCCLKERERTVRGRSQTIGQMFEEERQHAVELPAHPFDACVQHIRQADKYQTVLFEEVRYSVPRRVAFEPVTVKAYVDSIVLVHKGQVVARHRRSRTAGEQILEPMHFTAALERKPAYLDHTKLFKELNLPAAFGELRRRLEKELGVRTGTRHYIRVLQLLGRYRAQQIAEAIESVLGRQVTRAELVEQKLAEQTLAEEKTLAEQRTPVKIDCGTPDRKANDASPVNTIIPGQAIVIPHAAFGVADSVMSLSAGAASPVAGDADTFAVNRAFDSSHVLARTLSDSSQDCHSTVRSADSFGVSTQDAFPPPDRSGPAPSDQASHDARRLHDARPPLTSLPFASRPARATSQRLPAPCSTASASGTTFPPPPDVSFYASDANAIRLPTVIVPPPDLRRFDQLLIHRPEKNSAEHSSAEHNSGDSSVLQGEDHDRDVVEAQPQDAALTDNAGGVCPALA